MRPRPSRRMFPHQVHVERLSETTGKTGGTKLVPTLVASKVVCLIDRMSGNRTLVGGGEVEKKRFVVLFPDPIELRLGDQLIDAANPSRIFRVDSFDNELNLDRLWVASCEQQVDPNNRQPG